MALSQKLDTLRLSLSCCTQRGDQNSHVLITEPDRSATLKKVTLCAQPGDWFSFNPDKGRKSRGGAALMSPLLSTERDFAHHRACDCVVFALRDGKLTVLYIDLKSGDSGGYEKQFKSTKQFVRYALGLLNEFHGHVFPSKDERYVILQHAKSVSINKMATTAKSCNLTQSQPSKPYKRRVKNGDFLYLAELLGSD